MLKTLKVRDPAGFVHGGVGGGRLVPNDAVAQSGHVRSRRCRRVFAGARRLHRLGGQGEANTVAIGCQSWMY